MVFEHAGVTAEMALCDIGDDFRVAATRKAQHARHALMADLMTFGLHGVGNGPQRSSLPPLLDHFPNCFLLAVVRDKLALVAGTEAERDFSAEIAAARFLVGLHLPDALSDAVTLGLGECGGDRQEQLGQAVAGNVAAKVEQMQPHAARIQFLDDLAARRGPNGKGDRASGR